MTCPPARNSGAKRARPDPRAPFVLRLSKHVSQTERVGCHTPGAEPTARNRSGSTSTFAPPTRDRLNIRNIRHGHPHSLSVPRASSRGEGCADLVVAQQSPSRSWVRGGARERERASLRLARSLTQAAPGSKLASSFIPLPYPGARAAERRSAIRRSHAREMPTFATVTTKGSSRGRHPASASPFATFARVRWRAAIPGPHLMPSRPQ